MKQHARRLVPFDTPLQRLTFGIGRQWFIPGIGRSHIGCPLQLRQIKFGQQPFKQGCPDPGPSGHRRIAGGDIAAQAGRRHQHAVVVFEQQGKGLLGQSIHGGIETCDPGKDQRCCDRIRRNEVTIMNRKNPICRQLRTKEIRSHNGTLPPCALDRAQRLHRQGLGVFHVEAEILGLGGRKKRVGQIGGLRRVTLGQEQYRAVARSGFDGRSRSVESANDQSIGREHAFEITSFRSRYEHRRECRLRVSGGCRRRGRSSQDKSGDQDGYRFHLDASRLLPDGWDNGNSL